MRPDSYAGMQNANAAVGAGYSQITAAPTTPTVHSEISDNDKRIQQLHQRISELESRLSPLLRATPPQTNGVGGTDPAPWSAVVCALRKAGFEIEAADARLTELLSRLDV